MENLKLNGLRFHIQLIHVTLGVLEIFLMKLVDYGELKGTHGRSTDFDGGILLHRESECSGSAALCGNRGQVDLFTSSGSRRHAFPLLSSTQQRHRYQMIISYPSVGLIKDVH